MAESWDEFENYGDPQQDWSSFESTDTPVQKPVETPALKSQSTWDAIKSAGKSVMNLGMDEVMAGAGEAALTMGTGLTGMAAGGLAGINAASVQPVAKDDPGYDYMDRENFLEGRHTFTSKPDPIEAVEGTQEAMTYQPRTEAGQATVEAVAKPFEYYDQKVKDIAFAAGRPDQTAGATAAYTALAWLPAAFGRGFIGKAKKVNKKKAGKTPDIEDIIQESNRLYKAADDANAAVTAESFAGVMERIKSKLTDEGYNPNLNPKTAAAFNALMEKTVNNQTIKGAEINRRIINNARGAIEKSDARMASVMMDLYDDWMMGLGKKDMLIGDPKAAHLVGAARELWSRKIRHDEIEWAIERAGTRAGQFTGSGFENALRTEFRQIAMNKKRMRRFSKDEQAAIKLVATGGTVDNLLRAVGRFAGRGPVSLALTGGIGAAMFGPIGAMGALAVGEVGRRGATALTIRNANKVSEAVRLPKKVEQ